jgi:3-oxoacyl-[acyl-carrier protein] reductase
MKPQQPAALVTGSSSGIGRAVARALLAEGWTVCLNGRDQARLEEARSDLELAGGPVHAVVADVADPEQARALVRQAVHDLGGLDLLVNNAGIGGRGRVSELSLEDWEHTLAVDLTGVFLVTREGLPSLRLRRGYVMNVSSLAGKRGMPGSSAYCAAKHGLMGFTESLLREEKETGVRATAICPAYVATPMVLGHAEVSAGEMIQPEDIASTVLYLLGLSPNTVVREVVVERRGNL